MTVINIHVKSRGSFRLGRGRWSIKSSGLVTNIIVYNTRLPRDFVNATMK